MRFSRPSPGTLLGGAALFVALGGTALAATGQVVNIADPSNATHVAKVDAQNRLDVGDGSGPMTVDGTVTAQQAPTTAFFHSALRNVSTSTCTPIVTPPGTKALVVRQIRIDTYDDPTPGPNQVLIVYQNLDCTGVVTEVNPPSVGQTVVPLDPGYVVPNGVTLSANIAGGVRANVFVDGYTVPGS